MKKFLHLLVVGILTLFTSITHASVEVASLPQSSSVPGGIAVIPIEVEAIEGNYRNERILLANYNGIQYAIVGIPLTVEAGRENLYLDLPGGQKKTISFRVEAKTYTEQHLTITNSRQVNPNASDLERISQERAEMDSAFSSWNEIVVPTFEMKPPVTGVRSSSFGLKRFFNGQARNPHSGMDIAAEEGTPIYAPAAGQIVATGNYFFNGNTIILDHGHGLISLYCHMNTIDVELGTHVVAGDQIGKVGQTGRVTGPHLHWSINLNNTRIDPALFLAD
ncbi:MAG: peptidase M23 [Acidimicrobiaceae bacterium]|mgnify:CR=1 FL=1|nr:peptidase M23 [Acidimicrobiaceae bacterium]